MPRSTPPGPRLLPFIGLGIAMQRDLLGLLERTSRRWDGLVRLGSLGPTPAYLAIAPDLVGQLLQRRWRDFVRDEVLLAAGTPVFGRGVLLATDDLHLRLRRTMQPASPDRGSPRSRYRSCSRSSATPSAGPDRPSATSRSSWPSAWLG